MKEPKAGLQEVWSSDYNNGLREIRPHCHTKSRGEEEQEGWGASQNKQRQKQRLMWVTAIIPAFKSGNKKYAGVQTKTERFEDHQRQRVDTNHGSVWMMVSGGRRRTATGLIGIVNDL